MYDATMRSSRIDAVLFDFDGTLTGPGLLDYDRIREEIGCPPEESILAFIASRETKVEREAAESVLLEHEERAAAASRPNAGAEEIVEELHTSGLRVGILTRNTRASVDRAFENFERLDASWFELVVTRDEGEPLKPDPASVRDAAHRFGIAPEALLMVGDFRHDIEAGTGAGSWTTLIRGDQEPPWLEEISPDYVIRSLGELSRIVRWHRPLTEGKLPNDMLAELLGGTTTDDALVVPPNVGEDVAALRVGDWDLLIAKSDPITFPTDRIGSHALTINTNDVLCSGGVPRWFLATAIFPPETTGWEIRAMFRDMVTAGSRLGVSVVGGHTEISNAVRRPLVSGALLGTAGEDELLQKRQLRAGDRIVMTKRPGLEGTAIIATDLRDALTARAVSPTVIDAAARFAERIDIVTEARVAARDGLAVALHDVTEGGVATALVELARAADATLRVDLDALEPYSETQVLCSALEVDPLGLIGSGSLLIALRPEREDELLSRLEDAGVEARVIGEVVGEGAPDAPSVVGLRGASEVPFPEFEVDELARLYSRLTTPQ